MSNVYNVLVWAQLSLHALHQNIAPKPKLNLQLLAQNGN